MTSTFLLGSYRLLGVLRILVLLFGLSVVPGMTESLVAPYAQDFTSLDNPRVRGQFTRFHRMIDAPKEFRRVEGFARTAALMGCSLAAQSLWSLDRDAERRGERADHPRRVEFRRLIGNVAETVTQTSLRFDPLVNLTQYPAAGGYGVYYGHVGIVLILHRLMTGDPRWDQEIEHLISYLWRESLRAPLGLIPPYAVSSTTSAYPADQSAVLFALSLIEDLRKSPPPVAPPRWAGRDTPPEARSRTRARPNVRAQGDGLAPGLAAPRRKFAVPQLTEAPRRPWRLPAGEPSPFSVFRRVMAAHPVTQEFGLHPSGVHAPNADIPRGVGTAYELINLSRIDPQVAAAQYERFLRDWREPFLMGAGFREWPRGQDRGMDADSGPVIAEIGLASSAFALASARRFEDAKTYDEVLRLGNWWGGYWEAGSGRRYLWLDVPLGLLQVLIPGRRDTFEAYQYMAEATLLRGMTNAPGDGATDGRYVERRWPWAEIGIFLFSILTFFACSRLRLGIDDLLDR